MKQFSRGWPVFAAALVLLLVSAGTSPVAAQETTGSISGTVVDASGAVLPNTKIEVTGGTITRPFATVSDDLGKYYIGQIPVGTYEVTATATGFQTVKKTGIGVVLGKNFAIDFKLDVGQITQTVSISADAAMVDTTSSSSAISVEKTFFDILPKGRSFYDLVGIAPGARAENRSIGFQIDGATGAENTFFLDGMEIEDIQGGNLSGQNRMPVEMVQQVQIKNGIMDAEYGGSMGGVVNAVTRSGNNEFHGQAGFYWTGNPLSARPRPSLITDPNSPLTAIYSPNQLDNYNDWNPVFNIGGPLWKNKLFFFSGYMPQLNDNTRTVTFTDGYVGTYNSHFKQQYLNNKVDFSPINKVRMSMSWIFNPNKTQGLLPGYAGTDDHTADWAHEGNFYGGNTLAGSIEYLATTKLVLSFRGGYNYTSYNNMYATPSNTAIYYSGLSTIVPPADMQHANGWISQAVAADKYDINTRTHYNADVSYILNWHGQHVLKGGWQMNQLYNDVLNSSYANGYYRYYWGGASDPDLTQGVYHCQTTSCQPNHGSVGYGQYGYYRYRVLGTVGAGSSNNQAMYIQDNWRVNKKLSINVGLRTEHEFVPAFSSGTTTPSPAVTFDWTQKMSPRVGVAFDPKGNGKQRIYFGWGYFYDIMKYSLPRGSFGGDVWKEYYYTLDDPNVVNQNNAFAADPLHLPGTFLEATDLRIPAQDPSEHRIDPNLRPMKQKMFDLGWDYSISPTLVASVRYTDRRLISTIEDIGWLTPAGEAYHIGNPGYGFVADPANALEWYGPGVPTTPKAVRNYDAVEFRLDQRFSRNFQYAVSYMWSRNYGNYSGLASTDEAGGWFGSGGRDSPNNSRYFDEPFIYGDSHGKLVQGLMPTDRPHTTKLFGSYTLRSKLGATTFSPAVALYSGTPVTTNVEVVETQGWMYPYGRGDMGRTPFFTNVDFNVMHDFSPFKNHESWKLRAEFSVFNLFNNGHITEIYNLRSDTDIGYITAPGDMTQPQFIQSIYSQGIDVKSLMQQQNIPVDPRYGMPQYWQTPRSARMQIALFF